MHSDWYDAMGSFANGTIVNNLGIKLSAADRVFMKNVISGIQDNKGEAWYEQRQQLGGFDRLDTSVPLTCGTPLAAASSSSPPTGCRINSTNIRSPSSLRSRRRSFAKSTGAIY